MSAIEMGAILETRPRLPRLDDLRCNDLFGSYRKEKGGVLDAAEYRQFYFEVFVPRRPQSKWDQRRILGGDTYRPFLPKFETIVYSYYL